MRNSNNPQVLIKLIYRLWSHFSLKQKNQIFLLLLLMVLASASEALSIGAVIPFLAVIVSPQKVFDHQDFQILINYFGITTPSELVFILTLFFGFAALVAGGVRVFLLWRNIQFSFMSGVDWSASIYKRSLYQPYLINISRNSSEIINGISGKASALTNTVLMLLNLVASGLMLFVLLATLFQINAWVTFLSCAGFGFVYMGIAFVTRKRLMVESQIIARESTNVIKALQEGLGGIRDVTIDGTQEFYCNLYRYADYPHRRAYAITGFISQAPRFIIEALGMLMMAFLAFILVKDPGGMELAIPILGAFALGAQRLLPLLQQAFSAWANIKSNQASLQDALDLLDQPLPESMDVVDDSPIQFNDQIQVKNLTFQYFEGCSYVIKDVNFSIKKGSCIGFIGSTGSGKSTLLDIIMGLLPPTSGFIAIDNQILTPKNSRSWQKLVAHVPQTIFLSDATILENIALGIPKDAIDIDFAWKCVKRAKIDSLIESLPFGFMTTVGERGVRLSGGQRQRIGIARALYKRASILVFDEATSALDSETEEEVMDALKGLRTELGSDLTVLIIAHRISTLKNCSNIYKLVNGALMGNLNYENLDGK